MEFLQELPRKTRLSYTQVSKADQRFYYDSVFVDGLLCVREAESNAHSLRIFPLHLLTSWKQQKRKISSYFRYVEIMLLFYDKSYHINKRLSVPQLFAKWTEGNGEKTGGLRNYWFISGLESIQYMTRMNNWKFAGYDVQGK